MKCTETKGDNVLSVLIDDAGFTLVLSSFDKQSTPIYPRDFHIGFIRDNTTQVNEIYQRMKESGTDLPPPRTTHGSWAFYTTAPGGISIEVSTYANRSPARSKME